MRVLDGEDVASHTAPESCVAFREGRDEALTGDCVVRCRGSEFLHDLTATFNQLAPPWTIVRIIVDGIEDRFGLEQLGSGGYVEPV